MRSKSCAYSLCGKSFVDESAKHSMSYCTVECRRRAKLERAGKTPKDGYLSDRAYTCQNSACGKSFVPEAAGQKFCSLGCRADVYSGLGDEARKKTCSRCGEPFEDTSPKNNQRSHPACSMTAWGLKPNPGREVRRGARLETNRRDRVRLGDGGRLDDIGTMQKGTSTWWGRVAELIYAAYRPAATDVNATNGSRSPYDFEDATYGRVDVRSAVERVSPQGRPMWVFQVAGLRESCDHAFLVGYAAGGASLAHLWLVPVSELNATLVRMSPGSSEYQGTRWDVSTSWGLSQGDGVLARAMVLPEPKRPKRRFEWVADARNFAGGSKAHKGRRGEFLYQALHPDSVDVNARDGMLADHDFEDADGTWVNVKTAIRLERRDRPGVWRWSFGLLNARQVAAGHRCAVYACLCLDETRTQVLRELRVPVAVLGARRLIHVYGQLGDPWLRYGAGDVWPSEHPPRQGSP